VDRNKWMSSFFRNEGAWVVGLASWPRNGASGRTDARFRALPLLNRLGQLVAAVAISITSGLYEFRVILAC